MVGEEVWTGVRSCEQKGLDMREITYLIYIVVWEGAILGGFTYLVFWREQSGWWFVLALLLSAAAYPPDKWMGKSNQGDQNE